MSRIDKLLIALAVTLQIANAIVFIIGHNWSALLWLAFGMGSFASIIMLILQKQRLLSLIESQNEYIKEADEHIHYLTQLDIFSKYRECSRQERIASANNFRYLQGLVRLKKENDQLKILNRNLLHNQGKGVKNYAKSTKPRNSKD